MEAYLRGDPITIGLAILGSVIAVYFSAVILIRQREVAQGGAARCASSWRKACGRMPALLGVTLVSMALLAVGSRAAARVPTWSRYRRPRTFLLMIASAVLALPIAWLLPGLSMAVAVAALDPQRRRSPR